MKIQIIYLDPQDDHASARDKLNACQAQRAGLVWPNRGRILTRRLDLVLLDRHARKRGVQIGLVTDDPTVRRHAQSIGIPTFEAVDDLTQEIWTTRAPASIPPGERDRLQIREMLLETYPHALPRSDRGIGQWIIGILGLGAMFMLAVALLPSAEIVLVPEFENQVLELEISLDPRLASPTSEGSIPAIEVSLSVQGELSRATSATASFPTDFAGGSVEFTNLTAEPITIPLGTGIRTIGQPAVRFQTTAAANLPAGPNSTVDVDVRALGPGVSGNVAADSILAVEGLLGLEMAVRNPEPTSGGGDEQQAAVSETDLTQLQQDLTQLLLEQAEEILTADLGEGQVLVAESLGVSRVISLQFDHAAGEASESLALSMELEVSGMTYERAHLEEALLLAMQAELAEGVQGVPGSIEAAQVGEVQPGADGLLTLHILASQRLYETVDFAALASQLQWRTVQEADAIIETQDLLTVEEIRIRPGWFPRLPMLALRISVLWEWQRP